jgi:hypothetical protein
MSERIYIVSPPPEAREALLVSISSLLPRIECIEVEHPVESLDGAQLVISFGAQVEDFLALCRQADLQNVGVIQARLQSFSLDNSEFDDVWESPLLDDTARVMLLDFPMLAVRLFPDVMHEIELAGTRELDDSSFFNIVTVPDLSRVCASVIAQLLSGGENWGRYTYASGGKVTWHRLTAYLCDDHSAETTDQLVAGAGIGVDRTLDGSALKFAFGIKPKPWRVGLLDRWRAFVG